MDSVVGALQFVLGCHHHNLSRVFTIQGRTYRVCCDCGAEFKYSLSKMAIERGPRVIPLHTCLRIASDWTADEYPSSRRE